MAMRSMTGSGLRAQDGRGGGRGSAGALRAAPRALSQRSAVDRDVLRGEDGVAVGGSVVAGSLLEGGSGRPAAGQAQDLCREGGGIARREERDAAEGAVR